MHYVRRYLALALCALFNAGCATTANYERLLQTWVDRSAEELVQTWGYPDDQLTAPNGNIVYVYRRHEILASPGMYRGYWYGGRGYSLYDPGMVSEFECTTFLEVDKSNRIVRWEWRGNNCVAGKRAEADLEPPARAGD